MSRCKYCQKEISWLKSGRKNIPIQNDGSVHKCQEFIKAQKSLKKINRSEMSPEDIAQYEKTLNQSLKK